MEKLLIVSPGQFGSHNGIYQRCIILKEIYHVTYFGLHEDKPEININDINVIQLKRSGFFISDKIRFILTLRNHLKTNNYEYCIIKYFIGCSVINLFFKKKLVVDVRSGFIYKDEIKNKIFNLILRLEVSLFKNITVISRNLSLYLKLPKRAHIIPVGSPIFPNWNKKFDSFKILYVGTFHQRNLNEAIIGFSKFYSEFKHLIHIELNIIGRGAPEEIKLIEDLIIDLGLHDSIKYLGEIRYPQLEEHFAVNNMGLSFIPITDYFNFQPPTKTFEYLSAGMITVATSTIENVKVINESNGVLVLDNKESIYEGFKFIYENRDRFDSGEIQNKTRHFSWTNIVYNNLIPFLNNID